MESTDAALRLCERLLKQDDTKDVDIEMSDGVLQAHSCILLAGSDAINGMFQHGSAAIATRKKMNWKQFSMDVGRFFLRLLYTGGLDELEWQLSSDIPQVLGLVAPALERMEGFYDLVDGYNPNGHPLWKKRHGNKWLFAWSQPANPHTWHWLVSGARAPLNGFDCCRGCVSSKDAGTHSSPDQVKEFMTARGRQPVLDESVSIGKAPPQPPLSLLLGALAIAKQYMFEDLLKVLIRATQERMTPHTFNEILSAAITNDITSLRLSSLQFAQQEDSLVKELHKAGILQFSAEVKHELIGVWDPDVAPAKRRKL